MLPPKAEKQSVNLLTRAATESEDLARLPPKAVKQSVNLMTRAATESEDLAREVGLALVEARCWAYVRIQKAV